MCALGIVQAALRTLHQRQMLREEKDMLQQVVAAGLAHRVGGGSSRSAREEMEEDQRQEVRVLALVVVKCVCPMCVPLKG